MAGTWKGGDVSIGAAASVRVVGNVSLGAFVLADRHGDGTAGALVSVGF
ncbi:MAG: hypothetical protein MJ058_04165 [Akkermansia sp.]|nr:hypothetical protein [Akkermansia sp.]